MNWCNENFLGKKLNDMIGTDRLSVDFLDQLFIGPAAGFERLEVFSSQA